MVIILQSRSESRSRSVQENRKCREYNGAGGEAGSCLKGGKEKIYVKSTCCLCFDDASISANTEMKLKTEIITLS